MNIKITLNDDEGQPVLILSNCEQPTLVHISYLNAVGCEVSIEDLKIALRKITKK
jgi:hypothetical protein